MTTLNLIDYYVTEPSISYLSKTASVLCCVVLCCAVQYRRPSGCADRVQHWHKHSLGLCGEDRGVGDRDHECALMRA
jgi:hypothetical protein